MKKTTSNTARKQHTVPPPSAGVCKRTSCGDKYPDVGGEVISFYTITTSSTCLYSIDRDSLISLVNMDASSTTTPSLMAESDTCFLSEPVTTPPKQRLPARPLTPAAPGGPRRKQSVKRTLLARQDGRRSASRKLEEELSSAENPRPASQQDYIL